MKALVARDYGPLENLVVAEVPVPVPGQGQILIRTEAAALNPADTGLITGVLRDVLPVEHPFIPGVDTSGIVVAVGEEYLLGLGAHEFIDYQNADVAAETRRLVPGGVDAVIDLALAGPALAGSAAAVRPGGLLVSPKGGPELFDGGGVS